MALEKQLANTDSIYCTKATSSNQTGVFLSNINNDELDNIFGADYKTDDEVRLLLNRRNLALNATTHLIDDRLWYERNSSNIWTIDIKWLGEKLDYLKETFENEEAVFIASLNKDDRTTNRLYLKGLGSLKREDGGAVFDLRQFLFSTDIIVLTKLENGDISLEIKIPKNPLLSFAHSPVCESTISADLSNYLSAIRTKPFILLAGMSGTGKTRIVRQLARGCCPKSSELSENQNRPGNYECIPVRPNWHDSTGLIGYVTHITEDNKPKYVITDFIRFLAKAWIYEDAGIPFFLCLDEMNLAPVEQYFAEYLSVIESRRVEEGKIVTDLLISVADEELLKDMIDEVYKGIKHEIAEKLKAFFVEKGGLPIPSNLIVMGTVNMDETTCSFPRKVLDRAMTFELNEVDMESGLEQNTDVELGSIQVENVKGIFTHGWQVYSENTEMCNKTKDYLEKINNVLNGTPFKFAYRTRDEVMIYCVERMKDGTSLAKALDEATMMKILSRIEGDEQIVSSDLLKKLKEAVTDELQSLLKDGEKEPNISTNKIQEMSDRLSKTGFTSFWS